MVTELSWPKDTAGNDRFSGPDKQEHRPWPIDTSLNALCITHIHCSVGDAKDRFRRNLGLARDLLIKTGQI